MALCRFNNVFIVVVYILGVLNFVNLDELYSVFLCVLNIVYLDVLYSVCSRCSDYCIFRCTVVYF